MRAPLARRDMRSPPANHSGLMLAAQCLSKNIEYIRSDRRGSLEIIKNRDDTSSHRNRGLTVLQIAIFTRSYGRIFGLAAWGNTFDQSVVVGLLKEGD
jgi:hypothetical protein